MAAQWGIHKGAQVVYVPKCSLVALLNCMFNTQLPWQTITESAVRHSAHPGEGCNQLKETLNGSCSQGGVGTVCARWTWVSLRDTAQTVCVHFLRRVKKKKEVIFVGVFAHVCTFPASVPAVQRKGAWSECVRGGGGGGGGGVHFHCWCTCHSLCDSE